MDYEAQEKLHQEVKEKNPFLGIINNSTDHNELAEYVYCAERIIEISLCAILENIYSILAYSYDNTIDQYKSLIKLLASYIQISMYFQSKKNSARRYCMNDISYDNFIDIMNSFEGIKYQLCLIYEDITDLRKL